MVIFFMCDNTETNRLKCLEVLNKISKTENFQRSYPKMDIMFSERMHYNNASGGFIVSLERVTFVFSIGLAQATKDILNNMKPIHVIIMDESKRRYFFVSDTMVWIKHKSGNDFVTTDIESGLQLVRERLTYVSPSHIGFDRWCDILAELEDMHAKV